MEWKVHLADIDLGEEEKAAVAEVLDSKWLTMGERTKEFERLFAEKHGAKHAVAVSSCTAALHLALQAAGVGPGDEVICPSMTFVASSNTILYLGAKPVFADIISIDTPTISPAEIEKKISAQTKAIVMMHYGGYPCEINDIMSIAGERSIPVIEDAAHAPMVEHRGKMLGTYGIAGCHSFYANKNITTAEGGMVTTDDPRIAERIGMNRCHGISHLAHERYTAGTVGYDVVDLGYNYRIDEIRAAIGIVQLARYEKSRHTRRDAVLKYVEYLDGIDGITVPFARYVGNSAYHIFGVVLSPDISRQSVIESMRSDGVQVSNHYTPVHLFSYYRERFGSGEGDLPVTEEYGRRQLTLPLYSGMSLSDVEYVSKSLINALS